jgi:hypothetical protein
MAAVGILMIVLFIGAVLWYGSRIEPQAPS